MREDGYTLAEALAAMLIIGLAMGGLFEGARVLSRMQAATTTAVAEGRELRRASAAFTRLVSSSEMADAGLAGTLRGGPTRLVYDCGAKASCEAVLRSGGDGSWLEVQAAEGPRRTFRLVQGRNPRLVYISTHGRFLSWSSDLKHGTLRAVTIELPSGGADLPLISARVWIEQSRACEFDLISKACRTPTP